MMYAVLNEVNYYRVNVKVLIDLLFVRVDLSVCILRRVSPSNQTDGSISRIHQIII